MNILSKFAILLSIATLAGCSGGSDKIDEQIAIFEEIRGAAKDNRAARKAPKQALQLTRAFLDTVTVPALAVTVENTGQTAYLDAIAIRKDLQPGHVTVWQTPLNEQIALRAGVLIGTKGLGRDLTSADAAPVISSLSSKRDGNGLRTLQLRNDNNGTDELRLQCEIFFVGPEVISIVERAYSTQHFAEKCVVGSGQVSNDYWIDSSGSVRQSRQWAGPYLGYLSIKLLKK